MPGPQVTLNPKDSYKFKADDVLIFMADNLEDVRTSPYTSYAGGDTMHSSHSWLIVVMLQFGKNHAIIEYELKHTMSGYNGEEISY